MTAYTVDAEAVATAARSTRTSGATISAEVAAMMTHLTSLETTWQGSASTQFAALAAQWRGTQSQVEANLDAIALALDNAARQYTDTETNATRLFTIA
ncbi:WXG100 family type VII secretion target [Serinibacter arcticus]|uniref:ESAT-6-like protein n=1 Tax=Serinibacter arcticus TaxID=1655435 RepID=A0A2U1ZYB9_9MICO|nr:WXG100 family type VII secretion target [Serinibacter arcticus]PWD51912.1 WXG100 family type VII secretion target [Serinibacter arcticus]